ncbi:MAG: DUF883 family protein [Blastochloris viridis]|uniref:DUF883 family protein n=1 Tax=Blastochloris viridis TaxID=1079 RepID=A0A6N4RDD7_BLAVI|nr:MAG: DUF883 family protein [Blastochloris viridis]
MARTVTPVRKQAARARTRMETARTSESVQDIKDDLNALKTRLESLAAAGADEGLVNVKQMYEKLHSKFEDLMDTDFMHKLGIDSALEKGHEQAEYVREGVRERPLQALVAAVGVGALVGFLLRR